jgi:hypothetical protein
MWMIGIKNAYLELCSLYRRRLAPLRKVFFRLLPTLVDFSASTLGATIDNSDDIRPLPSYSEARYWVQ